MKIKLFIALVISLFQTSLFSQGTRVTGQGNVSVIPVYNINAISNLIWSLIQSNTITGNTNLTVFISSSSVFAVTNAPNIYSGVINTNAIIDIINSNVVTSSSDIWTNKPTPSDEDNRQISPSGTNELAKQFVFGSYDPSSDSTNAYIRFKREYDDIFNSVDFSIFSQNTNGYASRLAFVSGTNAEEIYIQTSLGIPIDLWPGQTDDPGAIVYLWNTLQDRVQPDGKLLSYQNNGVERFYIGNLAGQFGFAGINVVMPVTNATVGQVLASDGGTPAHWYWTNLSAGGGSDVWTNDPTVPGVYVPSYGNSNLVLFGFGNDNIAIDDPQFNFDTAGAGVSSCFALYPSALSQLTNAFGTIAMGNGALQFAYSLGAQDNADVVIGYNAAQGLKTGQRNVIIGADAGTSFGEGLRNTLIGCKAGWTGFQTNDDITAIGYLSLGNIGKVSGLTAVGSQALQNNSSGLENTAIGFQAGTSITTGKSNTFIGYLANGTSTGTNQTVLGDRSVATLNNQVILGNDASLTYRMAGVNSKWSITNALSGQALVSDGGSPQQLYWTNITSVASGFVGPGNLKQIAMFSPITTAVTNSTIWQDSNDNINITNAIASVNNITNTGSGAGVVLVNDSSGNGPLVKLGPNGSIIVSNGPTTQVFSVTNGYFKWSGESVQTTNITTTSATVGNSGMSVSFEAAGTYTFDCEMFLNDSVAADGAKIDFGGGTATASTFIAQVDTVDTAPNVPTQLTSLTGTASCTVFTGAGAFHIHGTIFVSANGTFIPRFAQVAHSSGTLTLAKGSYLRAFNNTP